MPWGVSVMNTHVNITHFLHDSSPRRIQRECSAPRYQRRKHFDREWLWYSNWLGPLKTVERRCQCKTTTHENGKYGCLTTQLCNWGFNTNWDAGYLAIHVCRSHQEQGCAAYIYRRFGVLLLRDPLAFIVVFKPFHASAGTHVLHPEGPRSWRVWRHGWHWERRVPDIITVILEITMLTGTTITPTAPSGSGDFVCGPLWAQTHRSGESICSPICRRPTGQVSPILQIRGTYVMAPVTCVCYPDVWQSRYKSSTVAKRFRSAMFVASSAARRQEEEDKNWLGWDGVE